jgi:uncharacterized membrane protein
MHIRNPVEWLFAQAAIEPASTDPEKYWAGNLPAKPLITQKINIGDLRAAITSGLRDFAAARTDVIFLCLIYPVLGLLIAAFDARSSLLPLLFPTAAGFALLTPLFSIGLYEMSRRGEQTGQINWLDVFQVLRSPSRGAAVVMGCILVGLYFLWLAVAAGIYDATLGPTAPTSVAAFATATFTTGPGWTMILAGTAAGAVFAVIVLAISVVSFPLLLDRPASVITAIKASLLAFRRNPVTLIIWGLVVTAGLVLGSIPLFLGLVVVLPVLGHATWHLYRRLIH